MVDTLRLERSAEISLGVQVPLSVLKDGCSKQLRLKICLKNESSGFKPHKHTILNLASCRNW